jgi:hypothetical protein
VPGDIRLARIKVKVDIRLARIKVKVDAPTAPMRMCDFTVVLLPT